MKHLWVLVLLVSASLTDAAFAFEDIEEMQAQAELSDRRIRMGRVGRQFLRCLRKLAKEHEHVRIEDLMLAANREFSDPTTTQLSDEIVQDCQQELKLSKNGLPSELSNQAKYRKQRGDDERLKIIRKAKGDSLSCLAIELTGHAGFAIGVTGGVWAAHCSGRLGRNSVVVGLANSLQFSAGIGIAASYFKYDDFSNGWVVKRDEKNEDFGYGFAILGGLREEEGPDGKAQGITIGFFKDGSFGTSRKGIKILPLPNQNHKVFRDMIRQPL
ncbi:MAG: hypothetical protein JNL01_12820 [Bdellovibrionales bacterium]|nr:hypothetical protein [Bdellovibrionales bacterium]